MRNPKIAVIGASSEQLERIKVILSDKGIDLVTVGTGEADAEVSPEWILDRYAPSLPNDDIEPDSSDNFDDGNKIQHWRGGSIKKGGRVKFPNRFKRV